LRDLALRRRDDFRVAHRAGAMAVDDVGRDHRGPRRPAAADVGKIVEVRVQVLQRAEQRPEPLPGQLAVEPEVRADVRTRLDRRSGEPQFLQVLRRHGRDDVVGRQVHAIAQADSFSDRNRFRAKQDPPARALDRIGGLRREKLAQGHCRKAEMKPAVADELRMHAQQRRRRASLERHVHDRERSEGPEPFNHRLADAEGAQIFERAHAVELGHIGFVEPHRAPGHAVVGPEIARGKTRAPHEIRQQAEGRRQPPVPEHHSR